MFSILHISDLHRSPTEPLDNDALVAALINDRDRYICETPEVRSPDVIVVSGDIIQGESLGASNWERSIKDQYVVASEFLEHLARRFLDGDRSRIVLVPGNHDVCWNTSFRAMQRVVEAEYPQSIPRAISSPNSIYRWRWDDKSLYRIHDLAQYENKLKAYFEFVEGFYRNSTLPLPLDRRRGYQLYEYDSKRIGIVAFESVYRNDCFSTSGAVDAGILGRCSLDMRDRQHNYILKVGVWHHSVQGPPMNNDYMDINSVHGMTGYGFQLGLHGHQHEASASTYNIQLTDRLNMAIVSAGSLCAGARELPRGQNRQYNIIVLSDDFRNARVHVREMTNGDHFSCKRNGLFISGHVDVALLPTVDTVGRDIHPEIANERRISLKAEELVHTGQPDQALELLKSLPLSNNTYQRTLALEAAKQAGSWQWINDFLEGCSSIGDKLLYLKALEQLCEFDKAIQFVGSIDDLDATFRNEIKERLTLLKSMRRK